jgi:hypothetical protein
MMPICQSASSVRYLGIEVDDSIEIAEKIDIKSLAQQNQ